MQLRLRIGGTRVTLAPTVGGTWNLPLYHFLANTIPGQYDPRVNWWIWALFGLTLFVIEIISPGGFYIFFFAVGALLVSALAGIGLLESQWQEWLIFSISSVLALAIFRRRLLDKFKPTHAGKEMDRVVGESAVTLEPLPPGGRGKVELRGTAWNAKNIGSAPLAKGARCKVASLDGLTVDVEPEN